MFSSGTTGTRIGARTFTGHVRITPTGRGHPHCCSAEYHHHGELSPPRRPGFGGTSPSIEKSM
ncbi:hypothetical protein CPB84DRAFT_1776860 [Gymnopilus junonius]|uniref:Uncharacterized protein n=1 Tax=Gymnopilus junonius TaxID=109634 RepID=A0A9P5NRV0_GYMJU|nr:hypothetical protein CPB84DRAFT_1776860 [Gymnopilus junonius]